MEYDKYQHLEKLGTVETDGILDGEVFVFSKLDGTNAQLWWDNGLKAGSRNRELTVESDNAGFYNWALPIDKFKKFFAKYPDLRLYGEWLVPHTIKNYRDNTWRNFYVFDVYQNGEPLPYPLYNQYLLEFGIDFIPPIAKINNPSENIINKLLDQAKYLIEEGEGEGVVIKNYAYRNMFGRRTWAKVVRQEFKDNNAKLFPTREIKEKLTVEVAIVDKFVSKTLVEKEYAKIAIDGWQTKFIPKLIHTVYYCVVTEEMWAILKEFKNPIIDFKQLQNLTVKRVKELMPNLF
jgi:hypothetical protein